MTASGCKAEVAGCGKGLVACTEHMSRRVLTTCPSLGLPSLCLIQRNQFEVKRVILEALLRLLCGRHRVSAATVW